MDIDNTSEHGGIMECMHCHQRPVLFAIAWNGGTDAQRAR